MASTAPHPQAEDRARTPDSQSGIADPILIFEVGTARLALRLRDVVEILPAVLIHPLPGGPAHVEGLVDVRGEVIPVFDLRGVLGMETRALVTTDHFLHCLAADRPVLLWVDRVVGLEDDARSLPDRSEAWAESPLISGVVRARDGIVMIHNLEDLLSSEDADLLAAAITAAADGNA